MLEVKFGASAFISQTPDVNDLRLGIQCWILRVGASTQDCWGTGLSFDRGPVRVQSPTVVQEDTAEDLTTDTTVTAALANSIDSCTHWSLRVWKVSA